MLEIRDLHILADQKEIIRGVSLTIKPGEIHALMGPNGSGKSSLALALVGHLRYKISSGSVKLGGKEITKLSPDKRAKSGLFLALQYPIAVPGVSVASFLRTAIKNQKQKISMPEFVRSLQTNMGRLKIDKSFASRGINDGFSGGEKKKSEVLQLSMLKPKYAILDEVDSGLDVDSLKFVANSILQIANRQPTKGGKRPFGFAQGGQATSDKPGILLITHYQRILKLIKPDFVHVMVDGRIVASGGYKLAETIEERGYKSISNKVKRQNSKVKTTT